MSPPVPAGFSERKARILKSLSVPEDEYEDASPKGSLDAGIRELIGIVNGLEGAVTTSSCAGRISIFLEGKKEIGSVGSVDVLDSDGLQGESIPAQSAVPGGKGLGGRWLFVSHDPVDMSDQDECLGKFLNQFEASRAENVSYGVKPSSCRLLKFAFEPMILHVMIASLQHAKPILAAALEAGFRESGVQSLKALDDPGRFPMVAIRTAGLGLSSVIGYASDVQDEESSHFCSLVDRGYLELLLALANERFKANSDRTKRLQDNLARLVKDMHGAKEQLWEDKAVRAERKRAEGLQQQAVRQQEKSRRKETGPDFQSEVAADSDFLNFLDGNI